MEIIPNVTGEVNTVDARPLELLSKGDPIFTIDSTQYESRVKQFEAQLVLSQANLQRAKELMERGVGRQLDVDIYTAESDSLELAAIPGGAVGTAAIYTDSVTATHVIRRIMLRMEAWINYIKP